MKFVVSSISKKLLSPKYSYSMVLNFYIKRFYKATLLNLFTSLKRSKSFFYDLTMNLPLLKILVNVSIIRQNYLRVVKKNKLQKIIYYITKNFLIGINLLSSFAK